MAIVPNLARPWQNPDLHWHGNADEVHGATPVSGEGGSGEGGAVGGATASDMIITAGGTTPRRLDEHLSDVLSIFDFGAAGDGSTDDSAALREAIEAVHARGGGTILLGHRHAIASTVTIPYSNILIQGMGSDENHNTGSIATVVGTVLLWTGPIGGTVLQMVSPDGVAAQRMTGGGVRNIMFYGGVVLADYGLKVISWSKAVFQELFFYEFGVAGLFLGVTSGLGAGEAAVVSECQFDMITCRQVEENGALLILSGDANWNACFNTFTNLTGVINNGDGIIWYNSDNNLMQCIRFYRADLGTGNAMVFHGSSAAVGQISRTNFVYHYSANAPTIAKGTASYTYPSAYNHIYDLDKDNNAPDPTVEAGATLFFTTSSPTTYVAWVPTITAGVGALGSTSILAARYKRWKDNIDFDLTFQIVDNGTGSGGLRVTLPITPAYHATAFGRDTATGQILFGMIEPATNVMQLYRNNFTYPGATANYYTVSGRYQV